MSGSFIWIDDGGDAAVCDSGGHVGGMSRVMGAVLTAAGASPV